MNTTELRGSKGLVATAQRTLKVLDAVAENSNGATAKYVARRTGLSSSTVYQYLNTLIHEGYLVRVHDGGTYALGEKSNGLNAASHLASNRKTARLAGLYALHQRAAAPFYLIRFRGWCANVVEVLDSPTHPRVTEDLHSLTQSVHASAFGRLLLSSVSVAERRRYLDSAGMARLTPSTPTRITEIEARMEAIYDSGISVEHGEFDTAVACIAAPVFGSNGLVTGAVAASTSRSAFSTKHRQIESALRVAAARLTA